uniref:Uncharacterized protein n=1 Tax=Octopus bimaculoides TaxID=37653 RepID=A0A0L8FXX0_OCTBM
MNALNTFSLVTFIFIYSLSVYITEAVPLNEERMEAPRMGKDTKTSILSRKLIQRALGKRNAASDNQGLHFVIGPISLCDKKLKNSDVKLPKSAQKTNSFRG